MKKISVLNAQFAATLLFSSIGVSAQPLVFPDVPLPAATGRVDPNIMLLFDTSGSMNHVLPDVGPNGAYDPNLDYGITCSSSHYLPTNHPIRIRRNNSNIIYMEVNGNNYDWGNGDLNAGNNFGRTGREARCFDPSAQYEAFIFFPGNLSGGGLYSGHFLNWYFSDPDNRLQSIAFSGEVNPEAYQRKDVAKLGAINLVNVLENVRLGFATYYQSSSASIDINLSDLDDNHKSDIVDAIAQAPSSGFTPLPQSFESLGRYFSLGYSASSDITIHPDSNMSATRTLSEVFRAPVYASGISQPSNVIQYSCQNNFIIAVTDGLPTSGDNAQIVSDDLLDYDGDCSSNCLSLDRKPNVEYASPQGNDYLDDVALALHDIDLRPDMDGHQNVSSYIIGFGDPSLRDNPLLDDTAQHGNGAFFAAENAVEFSDALTAIIREIEGRSASSAGASANSSSLSANSLLFQPSFNSTRWSGDVNAFSVEPPNGILAATPVWSASEKLDSMAPSARNILTYSPSTDGVRFEWDNLTAQQRADLAYDGSNPIDEDYGRSVLAYVRGDRSLEGDSSDDFRRRDSALGDFVNSSPLFVGNPEQSWPPYDASVSPASARFGSATQSHSDFVASVHGRTPMVYIGANDGMLHGFDASKDATQGGRELMAYIPNVLYSSNANQGLHYLKSQNYTHRSYVDATPSASDVFINGEWRTILVGGLNAGGRGLYALDITDPTAFASTDADDISSLVLWEFGAPDVNSSSGSPNLGYTFSRPVIAMTKAGWAVIVGNGYNNTGDGQAKLLVLLIEEGLDGAWTLNTDYVEISTGVGTPSSPNGLSSPRAADVDGDAVVDYVYAGDLQGNMWAFDLTNNTLTNWRVAHGGGSPQPLFTASSGGQAQPITTAPTLAKNPHSRTGGDLPDILVMFGTGQYIQPTDPLNNDVMSFYAVWDRGDASLAPNQLAERTLVVQTSNNRPVRSLTGSNIDWDRQYGWRIDFPGGERSITDSRLRGEALFFNTNIPNTVACGFGGSGWINAVQFDTGLATDRAAFDADGSGLGSSDDGLVSGFVANGLIGASAGIGDKFYTTNTGELDGSIVETETSPLSGGRTGRLSWEELLKE